MKLTLGALQHLMREFIAERGWKKRYNKPKDIALSISVEAAELLEIFQWLDDRESKIVVHKKKQDIERELADIILYCVNLGNAVNIDLNHAIIEKIEENKIKYPTSKKRSV